MRQKICKNWRTASLNLKFTDSYKNKRYAGLVHLPQLNIDELVSVGLN